MAASYPVPHVSNVPFTLADGKEIIVSGVVNHGANRFAINLCVGRDHNSETPLHFNARFDQNEVIRNHNYNGWGAEEKHGGFPFQRGVPFEVRIIARNHGYQVYVNNVYHSDFNHRRAKESVRHVYIEGDVTLNRVAFLDLIYNPPVPFTVPIHGGAYPGRTFRISGVPTGGSRFSVNLVCGPSFDNHDVALTFDARFNYGSNFNQVIRNHKAGGSWGGEEAHQNYFPFSANVPFEITILVEHHGYKVAVNNQHFLEFHHRVQYQRVSHLNVQGDVRLTEIKL